MEYGRQRLDFYKSRAVDMEQIIDYRYPLASTYQGHADLCEYEVSLPSTIFFDDMLKQAMITNFQSNVREHGVNMLWLKVWQDYQTIESEPGVYNRLLILKGEAVATHPLPVAAWVAIVQGALFLAGLVVILLMSVRVTQFFYDAFGGGSGGGGITSMGMAALLVLVAVVLLSWQPWKKR